MKQKTLINKKMNTVDKLNHLIGIVKSIPKNQFNTKVWHKETKYGAVGCIMGWACLDPIFKKLGLEIRRNRHICPSKFYEVLYKNKTGFEAAMEFFSITLSESSYIFNHAEYLNEIPIKQQVIERIKEVRDAYIKN